MDSNKTGLETSLCHQFTVSDQTMNNEDFFEEWDEELLEHDNSSLLKLTSPFLSMLPSEDDN